MELEQRIRRGDEAKQVIENPAFRDAIDQMKQEITEQWKQSPARDQEGREKLYQLQRLIDKLESTLQTTLETGKLGKLELKHQDTMYQRAKSVIGLT